MNENPHAMINRPFRIWQQPEDPHPFPNNPPRPPWATRKGRKAPAGSLGKVPRRFAKRRFTRFAPLAPRNTTSFIIRAKKAGGIASLASPYPVTPAVIPTPKFSPSSECLVDMAKEEWGVDGYGSMNGLIRLRFPRGEDEDVDEGSDVDEHVEVEKRLDQDLSRFEMVYNPENWWGDRDVRAAELEEENLSLRERLFLIEREVEEMKSRLLVLEMRFGVIRDDDNNVANEEVLDNEGAGELCSEER